MLHLTWRQLPAGALFICALLSAETLVIDAGGPTDSGFTAGAGHLIPVALLPPGTTDATLRFGPAFSYSIPCQSGYPYILTFRFIEPSFRAIGQRVFSVHVNNQVVLDRIDLVAEAGYLVSFTRSVVAVCTEFPFRVRFLAQVWNAVISSIEVASLGAITSVGVFRHAPSGLLRVDMEGVSITGFLSTDSLTIADGWSEISLPIAQHLLDLEFGNWIKVGSPSWRTIEMGGHLQSHIEGAKKGSRYTHQGDGFVTGSP